MRVDEVKENEKHSCTISKITFVFLQSNIYLAHQFLHGDYKSKLLSYIPNAPSCTSFSLDKVYPTATVR